MRCPAKDPILQTIAERSEPVTASARGDMAENKYPHRVGWIGAGRMGAALVARLLASDVDLWVYNRTRSKAEPLAAKGAKIVDSPADLAERDMLGDCGANALGAVVGSQVAFAAPRAVRVLALAGVVGLTFASEKVSFSAVIDGNDVLRRVDAWGRRPA